MKYNPAHQSTILVVEDEVVMARDIEMSLKQHGFQVAGVCSTTNEALEFAAENHPGLALMDIGLGAGRDGIEGALELRKRYDIPVIYLTGHTSPALFDRAKATNPLGYLTKPLRIEDLRWAVELALETIARRKEHDEAIETMWYHATHDPMSGLLNRTEFVTRLTMIMERARVFPSKARPCLLFLDAEGLRKQNEQVSLLTGDAALKTIGEGLQRILPLRDPACRWDGDLFAVLLNVCPSLEEAQARALSIVEAIETAPVPSSPPVKVDFGFTFFDGTIGSAEDLIHRAYSTMCRQKGRRKGDATGSPRAN